MSNMQTNPPKAVPGFWTRLVLVAEAVCESREERMEKRIRQLEDEIERLAALQKKLTKA